MEDIMAGHTAMAANMNEKDTDKYKATNDQLNRRHQSQQRLSSNFNDTLDHATDTMLYMSLTHVGVQVKQIRKLHTRKIKQWEMNG